jgi:ATP-dependent Clp protease ATP-binding subunit ClpB
MRKRISEAIKNNFKPEFINRIDETIIFHRLGMDEIKKIVEIQIKNLKEILSKKKLTLKITEKAEELLAKEGFDSAYGARPLKRVIQKEVQNVLAMKLLNGEVKEGDSIIIDVTGPEGRKLDFKIN